MNNTTQLPKTTEKPNNFIRKWIIYEYPDNKFEITKENLKNQPKISINAKNDDDDQRNNFVPNPKIISKLDRILEKSLIFNHANDDSNSKIAEKLQKSDERLLILKYSKKAKISKSTKSKTHNKIKNRLLKSIVFSENLSFERANETGISKFVKPPKRVMQDEDEDEIDKRINEAMWHF